MKFEIVPAHDLSFAEQAQIFNRAFAGYLVKFPEMDAAGVAQFMRPQGVDLCYSRFVRVNGELAGFGCINRTGNITRLAGMGVVPEARRTGAATFLLSHLLEEAKWRCDRVMVLEVFEQNVPALALYRRHQFREVTRLFGWRGKPTSTKAVPANLEEISIIEVTQTLCKTDYPDVPWQVSRYVVAKLPEGRAYKIGTTCAVIGNPSASPIRIYALLGSANSDSVAKRDILIALSHKFPEAEFFAAHLFPEEFIEVFEPLGFKREPLNQFLMRREL